jgi:acetyl-CoA synthetase
MRLEYKSYEEAKRNFSWGERWEVFDKSRDALNIPYECIDRHPKEKTAIRLKFDDGRTEIYTFRELSRLTSKFANMLKRKGIEKGDRVAIMLHPSLEYYVSFHGALKRGAVAVPCYALLGPDGIDYRLRDSGAKMMIVGRDRSTPDYIPSDLGLNVVIAEELIDLLESEDEEYKTSTSADTLAVIQYSSGTTGLPKQVLYNHEAIGVTAVYVKLWLGLKEDDKYMCTSSPAWGHGIWYGTVGPLIFGNGIGAYSGRLDPVVLLQALEQFEITVMSAIPRVYAMIMDCGKLDQFNLKLRRLTYTGSAIDKKVQEYFIEKLGFPVSSTYGNTEVGPIAIDYAFDDYEPRIGSSGRLMLGTVVAAIDDNGNVLPAGEVGELAVLRKGKWVNVGDLGFVDKDGYLWSKGRSDDIIKSSGYRIGPFEIESVLEKHPDVEEAAVVGSPDKERGEIVKAFIVAKRKGDDEFVSEIQEFVKRRLSMHEYPKEIEFVSELPKTPDGKLRRKVLKEQEVAKKGMRKS